MFLRLPGRDVRLLVHRPDASEADLARVAGVAAPAAPRLLVDAALRRGERLGGGSTAVAGPSPGGLAVAVVGGLDSGRRVALSPDRLLEVGRSVEGDGALALADPAVSRRHARIEVGRGGTVRVHDGTSRNGTWWRDLDGEHLVDGAVEVDAGTVVRAGASLLAVGRTEPDDRPVGDLARPVGLTGTVAHNRPPRAALPSPPDTVTVPSPPEPRGARLPLSIVAILGPMAMAGAMVWLLGNPAFALFALLAPVLAIGNHVEGTRRETKGTRRDAARWAAALGTFAAALADAAAVERERRLASAPDAAEVGRRAAQPSMWLWERRPHHEDWLRLRVGVGDVPWAPPLAGERHGPRPDDLADAIAAASVLPDTPVTVELAGGGVVGVVGPRSAALAVARSLVVQAAVHHGPSDLAALVAVDPERVGDWDWVKWLPHVEDPAGGPRRTALGRAAADVLATAWAGTSRATLLLVVDGNDLLAGRRAPLRALLDARGGPVAGIVVAAAADRLPAACTAVVLVDEHGGAELRLPSLGVRLDGFTAMGVGAHTAARTATALARFDDPELDGAGASLPPVVALRDLLDLDDLSPVAVARCWAGAGSDPAPRTPIGVDPDGTVELDLAVDGPHALVAGTTGAGKSELLRSLVAGLAVGCSPDHLTFVLVDFKGGSAFDACARLPHVVGLVTDLDEVLAERALRCLEAELRHRERVLRAAGAPDLAEYRAAGHDEPLPRLVVVVDEFATLKAELPEFVDALVGVAQRGRSLGVHLVLATQRPAGSVSDHVRANANLRIALRVQDAGDSADVIDGPQAASLPRTRPGRACVRLGPGELLTVQTALATARSGASRPAVELVPFVFGSTIEDLAARTAGRGPTDLDLLVDACAAAFARSGRPEPRRPWPEPLPAVLDRADDRLASDDRVVGGVVVVGLADDPDHQRQVPAGWVPADGNLVVYGVAGSGTTTTLLAVALARCEAAPPPSLQLFALDHGAGELGVLAGLPHTAAVVGAGERERQQRLVRHLRAELDRRKAAGAEACHGLPAIDLLVDGVGSFLADFDDIAGMELTDAFGRIVADGPEVGIRVVIAAERAGALPAALTATVRQRWVHRLADAMDAATAGVGHGAADRAPSLATGRYLDAASGLEVQVAVSLAGWAAAVGTVVAAIGSTGAGASPSIRVLPSEVDASSLVPARLTGTRPWTLPVGIADHDLDSAVLTLHEGDHVLVAGPARSGRTTALAAVAAAVHRADPERPVVALASRRSWLDRVPGVVVVAAPAAAADALGGAPGFLLVDDADAIDDHHALDALLAAESGVHVVAAGRADVLRGLYVHWTRSVRRCRLGVLLRPNVDLDGELLGAVLPRRSTAPWVDGRGYLVVDGAASLVQVARLPG